MKFFVGDTVHVCTTDPTTGMWKHLYDATVVEADEWKARVLVRDGTYGFWYYQEDGTKIGISTRYISKKIDGWRSIDDE